MCVHLTFSSNLTFDPLSEAQCLLTVLHSFLHLCCDGHSAAGSDGRWSPCR